MRIKVVQITPALYGITAIYAWRAVDDRWDDLFAPILVVEDVIHEKSFRTYILAGLMKAGEPSGFKTFREQWINKKGGFWHDDSHQYEEPMRWIFHEYWTLANRKTYWQDGKFRDMGGWLDYHDALAKWQEENEDLIAARKDEFETWKDGN